MSALASDATSLLVPVQVDAWVVNSSNTQSLALYKTNYAALASFDSLEPPPFATAGLPPNYGQGINLHWSLPDAFTHGTALASDSGKIVFPYVPNRWMVLRFNVELTNSASDKEQWQAKLWVIKSDQVGPIVGNVGAVAAGSQTLELGAGTPVAIPAHTVLLLLEDATFYTYQVQTTVDVAIGATQIPVQSTTFSSNGGVLQLGTSNFLDPSQPSQLKHDMTTAVNEAQLGMSYSIEAWESGGATSPSNPPFLTAVGTGNVSFAAYQPFVNNVFAFTDPLDDLPQTGSAAYSYLVVGWYAEAASDPMAALTEYPTDAYLANIWKKRDDWEDQTGPERLAALLTFFKWNVGATPPAKLPPANLPQATLCHGLVAGVQWPYTGQIAHGQVTSNPNIPAVGDIQMAIGNSAPEALAALIGAQADPAGDTAPSVLAALVQAALYDLLDDYGQPSGETLVAQQALQAAFGHQAGGIVWEVVPLVPPSPDKLSPPLPPGQAAAIAHSLAQLNTDQRAYDKATRQLQSLQASLYQLWLKTGMSTYNNSEAIPMPLSGADWSSLFTYLRTNMLPGAYKQALAQYNIVQTTQDKVPNLFGPGRDPVGAWVATHWAALKLTELGLQLKPSTEPPFWYPTDPTLLLTGLRRAQKFGEDGRYNTDGTLNCRLPGVTITGLQLTPTSALTSQDLAQKGVNLLPYGNAYQTIPAISLLVAEAFFADASNSGIMAAATGADSSAITAAINGLVGPVTLTASPAPPATTATWLGTPPAPFSLALWAQPWIPLYLEWELSYFPTGTGTGSTWEFSLLDNWQFDGNNYTWKGTGYDVANTTRYAGRTVLTAGAPLLFKDKVQKYLASPGPTDLSPTELAEMQTLLTTIGNWDVVSQSLSGLTDQLVTLLSQQTFPPPPDTSLSGRGTAPTLTTLIGDQYHMSPMVSAGGSLDGFLPIRGGFLQFTNLRIIDTFGQVLSLFAFPAPAAPGDLAVPLHLGQGLAPSRPGQLPTNTVQLPPRAVQSARLNLNILSNDSTGGDIVTSRNTNAICGWLLPNHLNGSLAVYDETGQSLGELLPPPIGWRPRPGPLGTHPPPATISAIPNKVLCAVLTSMQNQSADVFGNLLQVIDETLWTIDPLGGRHDQALSVLIGRPLAVVQMSLGLEQSGPALYSQTWPDTVSVDTTTSPPTYHATQNTGEFAATAFPVRLGSLSLRNDGVIGYFLPAAGNTKFYAVHSGATVPGYIQPIMQPATTAPGPTIYAGDIKLCLGGPSTVVTLLLDPRGSIHAATGVLPVTATALAPHVVEDFLRQIQVTFQTGPLLADAGTLRLPLPAEKQGTWNWVQQLPPAIWQTTSPVDADDRARMPLASPRLHEGWLQLTLPDQSS